MEVDIILDAGHGGFDNGASYMGRAEKDDVLRLTLAVGAKLKEAGYNVYYTRTTDVYNSPNEKAQLANLSGGNYFISFHRNSGMEDNLYNGVQTLIYQHNDTVDTLAENINRQLENVGFKNLGVEEVPGLIVLRKQKCRQFLWKPVLSTATLITSFLTKNLMPSWMPLSQASKKYSTFRTTGSGTLLRADRTVQI